jgi:hypothetical protein
MKSAILSLIFLGVTGLRAQKYALLDMQLTHPVKYTNDISTRDNYDKYLAVEKNKLPEFLKELKEIERKLKSKKGPGKAGSFEVGCVLFSGKEIDVEGENRLDYVITSTCEHQNVSMHLCDARLSNESNVFFISTWITYIESGIR